jgi:hypothetical protein
MARTPPHHRGRGEVSADPGLAIPDPQRPPQYEPSHVIQLLVNMQKDVTANATKLDRAIIDLGKLDDKISKLSSTITWIKGFAAAAFLLIPICVTIVWWFMGDRFTDIKNQIMHMKDPPIVITPKP